MPDKKFTIRINGEDRDFGPVIGRVKRQLGDLKSAIFSVQGALAGLGVGLSIRGFLKTSDSISNVNARLRLAVKTAMDYTRTQRELFRVSQDAATPIEETIGLYAKLDPALDRLNIKEKDRLALIEATTKSLQLSGASTQEAASVIRQLTQALGRGVLRGDEFVSFMENGQRAARALAAGLGVPETALQQLAETGQLTSERVIRALISQRDVIAKEYASLGDTGDRELSRIGNVIKRLVNNTSNSTQATQTYVGVLRDLREFLEDPGTAAAFQAIIGAVVTVTKVISEGIVKITEFSRGIGEILAGASGFGQEADALNERIEESRARLATVERQLKRARGEDRRAALKAERDALLAEIEQLKREQLAAFGRQGAPAGEATPTEPTAQAPTAGTGVPAPILGAPAPTGFGKALEDAVERQNKASERLQESMHRAAERIKDTLDPLRELNRELEQNAALYEAGYLSAEEYARANEEVNKRIADVRRGVEEGGKAIQTASQFTIQAARNIQTELSGTIFSTLKGEFKDIGQRWLDLLNQMASQAAAAKIGEVLFGEYGETGEVGGLVGQVIGVVASSFHSGGIAGGPAPTRRVPAIAFAGAPRYHRGGLAGNEVATILQRGEEVLTTRDPRHRYNGGGGNVVNNFQISGPVDERSQQQIATAALVGAERAKRRNT